MILRRGTAEDATVVADLEGRLFGADAWSGPLVVSELTSPDRWTMLAVEDSTIIGYVVTMRGVEVADLHRIGVHPDSRGRGVGAALLEAALERAALDGALRMLLEVNEHNAAALSIYDAAGFVEIDRRRRYYRDGDALVLSRPLTGQEPRTATAPE